LLSISRRQAYAVEGTRGVPLPGDAPPTRHSTEEFAMRRTQLTRRAIFTFGLATGMTWLLGGCGGSSSSEVAAPISPEMQKQTDEMLKNYSKEAQERGRAEALKRRRR